MPGLAAPVSMQLSTDHGTLIYMANSTSITWPPQSRLYRLTGDDTWHCKLAQEVEQAHEWRRKPFKSQPAPQQAVPDDASDRAGLQAAAEAQPSPATASTASVEEPQSLEPQTPSTPAGEPV